MNDKKKTDKALARELTRFLNIGIFTPLAEGFPRLFFQSDGGVAQLVRAFGSYPKCRRFESASRHHIFSFLQDFYELP
jgi:hypothetical protein